MKHQTISGTSAHFCRPWGNKGKLCKPNDVFFSYTVANVKMALIREFGQIIAKIPLHVGKKACQLQNKICLKSLPG